MFRTQLTYRLLLVASWAAINLCLSKLMNEYKSLSQNYEEGSLRSKVSLYC